MLTAISEGLEGAQACLGPSLSGHGPSKGNKLPGRPWPVSSLLLPLDASLARAWLLTPAPGRARSWRQPFHGIGALGTLSRPVISFQRPSICSSC